MKRPTLKGWRKLKNGAMPRQGDRIWIEETGEWCSLDHCECDEPVRDLEIIVREVKRKP